MEGGGLWGWKRVSYDGIRSLLCLSLGPVRHQPLMHIDSNEKSMGSTWYFTTAVISIAMPPKRQA